MFLGRGAGAGESGGKRRRSNFFLLLLSQKKDFFCAEGLVALLVTSAANLISGVEKKKIRGDVQTNRGNGGRLGSFRQPEKAAEVTHPPLLLSVMSKRNVVE